MKAALLLLMCLTAPAVAGGDYILTPPEHYDHPFDGKKLTILAIPRAHIQFVCAEWPRTEWLSGCAFTSPDFTECTIYIRDDPITFASKDLLIRHEIAHCNGWPANHPD